MLSWQYLKNNLDDVKKSVQRRGVKADPDKALELYLRRNALLGEIDALRQKRNANSEELKKGTSREKSEVIAEGRALKASIAEKESALGPLEEEMLAEAKRLPNCIAPEAPDGKDESCDKVLSQDPVPQHSFRHKDHLEIMEKWDLVDFEAGAKVTGPRFYYLKNEAVLLEQALIRYALGFLRDRGFTVMMTPDIARTEIVEKIGFAPRGSESNLYNIAEEPSTLVGTAEITLGGYHSDEIVDLSKGPILMGGISHCFRKEAGAAGQFSKGLYRVHQFSKVEMFAITKPEDSSSMHLKLRSYEEELFHSLGLSFRVIEACCGELGAPAYRKFDLEAWMPGRGESGEWGEITSTSNCTDFQARRLKIRYKNESGETAVAHTLNGTAVATTRALLAIVENFQDERGVVTVPEVLVPFTGFKTIGGERP